MRYIPNSPEERAEMLEIVGLKSADELFRSIPKDVQLGRALNITEPLAEPEVISGMEKLAEKNKVSLSYEAAVAGGIPVIKTIREGLTANKIKKVMVKIISALILKLEK